MLKRMSLKKILVCSLAIFSLSILHFIPNKNLKTKQVVEYVDQNNKAFVFLENNQEYLTRVSIDIKNTETEKKARELINSLISGNSKIFKGTIPKKTKINSIKYEGNIIKIDFSKELLNVSKKKEEKMIESIVYTLTNIDGVDYVIIYIDGEILTMLPKSKTKIPATLDRSFGINKEYNITSDKNINQTTIYYIENFHNQEYYVPVTKVSNDTRDKIEIIVDELSHTNYNHKLMSYLNSNTRLVSSSLENNNFKLVFNDYILNDSDNQEILKEVIDTICMSIEDNYNVESVSFVVNDQEIKKTDLKSLE